MRGRCARLAAVGALAALLPGGLGAEPAWRLAGTVLGGQEPLALIEQGAQLRRVALGGEVSGCRVSAIAATQAVLDCAGERLVLPLDGLPQRPAAFAVRVPREEVVVPGAALRALLDDPQALVRQLRLEPRVAEGMIDGWAVAELEPEGLLARSGLRTGDVIVALQGVPAAQPDAFMATLHGLHGADDFELRIRRDAALYDFSVQLR